VVCGPFERHAEMCNDAIDRGIHVLTEKPAALTFAQLKQLREALERQPKVHLAGMMFSRYSPGFHTAHRLIEEGAIGDVRVINARKSYKLGARPSYYHERESYGGTIPWVGSHAIDWMMWLCPHRIQSVYAMHSTRDNGGNGTMERSAVCQFELDGERMATISIDVFRPENAPTHGDDWARVVGTSGVMEIRQDSLTLINSQYNGPVPVASDRQLMRNFIDHIEGRGPALLDAASTLALTDACLRARLSADERRVVRFDEAL
jgi:predicted dehydrogenase